MKLDKQHYTFTGFNSDGSKSYKSKRTYDTELKAHKACFELNLKPEMIHKMVSYKCPICQKWHIGHHNTILSEGEKTKIKQQYTKWKIVNNIK